MKKQKPQSLSLFESNEQKAQQQLTSTEESSPSEQPKIKDACPRCGSRLAPSKRPRESGGSHYCLGGCLSEDRMDCFYFIPVKETPF